LSLSKSSRRLSVNVRSFPSRSAILLFRLSISAGSDESGIEVIEFREVLLDSMVECVGGG
jgi:hypothetical protein